jgi:hypothetical protein
LGEEGAANETEPELEHHVVEEKTTSKKKGKNVNVN